MSDGKTIGDRLRLLRRERGLSQEDLARRSGLSRDLIAKLEQNRRTSCRITSLMRLANALDVELTELTGKRERLGTERDGGSVLALRDTLLSPSLLPGLPGMDLDDAGQPTPLPELHEAVDRAWTKYWAGDFGPLVATVPGLITEIRLTRRSVGPATAVALSQAYQLASALMEHFGKMDLAALAAERAVVAAAEGEDELQWAMVQRTYGWVLLNQGRPGEAENLAVRVASMIEPSFSAPAVRVAVWGSILIGALWAAVDADKDVSDYITMIAAGAERLGGHIATCQTTFGSSRAAMHIVHAHAVLREPGKALEAAKKVKPSELGRISYGRHLIDLAQVHADARQFQTAERRLQEARAMSPVWFRHQLSAQSIVADIQEKQTRLSPTIRSLARSVGLD